MRLIVSLCLCAALVVPAAAQTTFPTIWNSSEVAATIAKAKAEIKPGATLQPEPIPSLASHNGYVEYRPGRAVRGTAQPDDELVYVYSGAGVFALGGHLVKGANGGAATEDQVVDGTMVPLTKGDMLVIPKGTPHQIVSTEGTLILIALRM